MEGKVIPVKVAVRSRPMVEKEFNEGCQSAVMFVPNEPQLVIGKDKAFTFDFVYSEMASQEEVYQVTIVPLVSGIFRGLLPIHIVCSALFSVRTDRNVCKPDAIFHLLGVKLHAHMST